MHLVFQLPTRPLDEKRHTTEGTEFLRSELREMPDPDVNWPAQGTHILDARCRVMQIPSNSNVIIGQSHSYTGKTKPLIRLRLTV
ncbi:polysaccharide lyase family 7 protein [Novipirellula caenicola]|uniref:polysaccharide lyase family 7 protein n=1 Tax=Novipirellula caenicola TaxID=1536901 RepID=UPI003CD0A3D6